MNENESQVAPEATVEFLTANADARPRRSKDIGKLALALAKAQGEMINAEKDAKGVYGKYATLAGTWDAIRSPLAKNEIAVYQRPLNVGGKLKMCTMLLHSSGQFLDDGELEMIYDEKGGRMTPMQAMGSAVTYARRYTLQSATGVAPADDDDGAGAGTPNKGQQQKEPPKNPPANQSKQQAHVAQRTRNEAPATDAHWAKIGALMEQKSVSEDDMNYLVEHAFGLGPDAALPIWVAEECERLLSDKDCNAAMVRGFADQKKAAREAQKSAPAQTQKAVDHDNHLIDLGPKSALTGKKVKDINESLLRQALDWCTGEKKKNKRLTKGQLEFMVHSTGFLTSMGVDLSRPAPLPPSGGT